MNYETNDCKGASQKAWPTNKLSATFLIKDGNGRCALTTEKTNYSLFIKDAYR
jgi:hypothetical protein